MSTLQKILLLSTDVSEEATLREILTNQSQQTYELTRIESLDQLHASIQADVYHAVLLDMRTEPDLSLEAIEHISNQCSNTALIALCKDHSQLQSYSGVMHLVDDYLLANQLVSEELHTRITHSIRRRRSEQGLLHEQTLLQSLLNNTPDAIFFKDLQSRFTKINRTMETIYGKHHKSIIGMTDFDLFAHEHAQQAFDDEQEIIRTGEPMVAKIEREAFEDGSVNWVSTTKMPLKDGDGRIIGTMGISRNVTELQIAQDTIAQERTLLKTIVDHALAGIFVKDSDGRFLMANQRHAGYLGAESEAEVLGKTLYDFVELTEADQTTQSDRQIMETLQGAENIIGHRQTKDGSDMWLLTSKVPLQDSAGKCTGLVGISLDVTEQKLNEQKLKSTIQTLEDTKLQLIEAEKLKTVGRLAAGVAHEVKNPLNVVSLGAEYLETQIEEPEDLVQIIRDMREAVERANDVIFELLDYSAPQKVIMEPANINDLISRIVSMMRHNFNKAGVFVERELDPSIEPVRLDTQKMEQVFINLFLNAIAVMSRGGSLTVRSYSKQMTSTGSNVSSAMTELFQVGDKIVVIEILDDGTGLSIDDENKAFDPFYSTKSTGEGTGLGLSVTRSIVEMHHGIVTLKNREDTQGACVKLLLPGAKHAAF